MHIQYEIGQKFYTLHGITVDEWEVNAIQVRRETVCLYTKEGYCFDVRDCATTPLGLIQDAIREVKENCDRQVKELTDTYTKWVQEHSEFIEA